ncbi:hypothetical protein ACJRPK_03405 [Aquimarina sp. 2-A2]|uniref:hypothetical protein n=1 Tax=Aquimarina sp. 2-A2 TaxID=3382644 RepID=UPI00387F1654
MKTKKLLTLILFIILNNFLLVANVSRGYTTIKIGNTFNNSLINYCSDNYTSTNYPVVSFNVKSVNPLEKGSIYELNDYGNLEYFIITEVKAYNSERDSFSESKFTLLPNFCSNPYSKKHTYKNLGNTYDKAFTNLCRTDNYKSLPILTTNIIISEPLPDDGVFIRTENNVNEYLLIIESFNTQHYDRDTYKRSDFSNESISICPNRLDKQHVVKYLGHSTAEAQKTLCSDDFRYLPTFRFNINTYTKLEKGTVYRRDLDGKIDFLYIISSSESPEIDRDTYPRSFFSQNPVQLSICDKDNDGVADDKDNCPSISGPIENNGCPIPVGNPNLVVDYVKSIVFSQCLTCPPFLDAFFSSGKKHLISNGGVGNINFSKLEIRNIGNVRSESTNVNFYFSEDNTLEKEYDRLLQEITIPEREPNISYGIDTKINGWDINENSLFNGDYFIIVDIDVDNKIDEGTAGENDNTLVIPITYTTANISSRLPTRPVYANKEDLNTIPYFINIYDAAGVLKVREKIYSNKEEKIIINSLPPGFYIIKSKEQMYKIKK